MNIRQERGRRPFLRTAALLLAAVLLFTGCAAQKTAESVSSNAAETPILSQEKLRRAEETPMGEAGTWTIFIYMCGSNLESDDGEASANLMEIMKAAPVDKVNVIVQTGGAKSWGAKFDDESKQLVGIEDMDDSLINISADVLQRYRVTDHMELLDEQPLASMGAEDTFYDFLKWGVENYPAEHMGVLLWNHGGAATGGVCYDQLYGDDSLLPFELNEAFQRLYPDMTDRFEFIGFDACLMSTVELANAISPFARYMYASEEVIPGYGLPYLGIFNALNADPSQDGAALGKAVCDSYNSFYFELNEAAGGSEVDLATLAVTDLEKMDAVVSALDALGDKLTGALDKPEELKKVAQAALHTESFAFPYMLDMGTLAENLESIYPEEAKALKDALSEAIVYSTHGAFSADSTGMSIFYPRTSTAFISRDAEHTQLIARYALCAPSQSYYEFVKEMQFIQYRASLSGVPNVHVLEQPHLEEVDEENIAYAMTLDSADVNKVAEMNYQVWMLIEDEDENGEPVTCGILLGSRLGVEYDETTGKVSDDFDNSWKWVKLNGVPLEMDVQRCDDDEVVYSAPILLNGNRTNLIIRWEKAADSYELLGTYTGFDEETNMLSREIYPLKDGDVIVPRYQAVAPEYIQAGFMEYPEMGLGYSRYIDVPEYATTYDEGNSRLEYTPLDDCNYYFQYYLTDIYGSRQAFAPLTFTMEDGTGYVDMPEDEEAAAASAQIDAAA